ncbi:hypothetical protein JSE7799_01078 [Jannaschia seosinensis]|uniref:Inner membrane protein YgaP-like transmembrane domain-containing protein n=1 Tax=Jannaschia seosinensis TaxID=313367 RepID=A0A0M7B8U7_9RHOB|nr:DUF2892 domain-containing protein [Jannaschia seosinensis]CUH34991.1 hypothetical protein JSE7799_01078 [Jannaschia seosinensis]
MIRNVGNADGVIRSVLGLVLIVMPLLFVPVIEWQGLWFYKSLVVGFILIETGFVQFCPLYRMLGVDTCRA